MATKLPAVFQTHERILDAVAHWQKRAAAGPRKGFLFSVLAQVQLKSNCVRFSQQHHENAPPLFQNASFLFLLLMPPNSLSHIHNCMIMHLPYLFSTLFISHITVHTYPFSHISILLWSNSTINTAEKPETSKSHDGHKHMHPQSHALIHTHTRAHTHSAHQYTQHTEAAVTQMHTLLLATTVFCALTRHSISLDTHTRTHTHTHTHTHNIQKQSQRYTRSY